MLCVEASLGPTGAPLSATNLQVQQESASEVADNEQSL